MSAPVGEFPALPSTITNVSGRPEQWDAFWQGAEPVFTPEDLSRVADYVHPTVDDDLAPIEAGMHHRSQCVCPPVDALLAEPEPELRTETACNVRGCRCVQFVDGRRIGDYTHCLVEGCTHTEQNHRPKKKPKAVRR